MNQNTKISNNFDQTISSTTSPEHQLLHALFSDAYYNHTPLNTTISTLLSLSTKLNFQSFVELRELYIGNIIKAKNDSANFINTHCHPYLLFNHHLFHATLLTNSPSIIDAMFPHINFNLTTFNTPYDPIDTLTCIGNYDDPLYKINIILAAIVDATEKGHYESIKHLIQHYQLSPTILIHSQRFSEIESPTNLLFYAIKSNNLQLIDYLLPLCLNSTPTTTRDQSICTLAENGHLHLIQQLRDKYLIDLTLVEDNFNNNLLFSAVQSGSIELIDYLMQEVGLDANSNPTKLVRRAIEAHQIDLAKYLSNIVKSNSKITSLVVPSISLVDRAISTQHITPDVIDYIITTFDVTEDHINNSKSSRRKPPLFAPARNGRIIIMKHLITKYNANPHAISTESGNSILHYILSPSSKLKSLPSLEVIEYLSELGLDFNHINSQGKTPIECLIQDHYRYDLSDVLVFQSLLDHKAEIRDIYGFITNLLEGGNIHIIEYFIKSHQNELDFTRIVGPNSLPLLHYCVGSCSSSVDFISYLVSLDTIDIHQKDTHNRSPIHYAMCGLYFNLDIIKLLIRNGVQVTIKNWLHMFSAQWPYHNPYMFFECLDYFHDVFGYDFESLGEVDGELHPHITYILKFFSLLEFHNNSVLFTRPRSYNQLAIYRALIHRYKANVNYQHPTSKNTVLHYLALNEQFQLISFTLLHSHQTPNVLLVNQLGQTFFHALLSLTREPHESHLEDILDCVIESISKIN